MKINNKQVWFVTGSQDLYGEETLRQVAVDAKKMVEGLNAVGLPLEIVWKPTVRSAEEIFSTCVSADNDEERVVVQGALVQAMQE